MIMSVAGDSPPHSSSSDDFAALLDAELDTSSSDASLDGEEEENEIEDDDGDEDDEVETGRNKRQRVDGLEDNLEEHHELTSLTDMGQTQDASDGKGICTHPSFIKDMCVKCGDTVVDGAAVAFGYIHKDLRIRSEEMARLRGDHLRTLLLKKKLILVLDLDHTLLNSTRFVDISPEEEYLKNQTDSLQDTSGSLFKLDCIHMMTKLRPFVRTFLQELSDKYEMYVYTMAERAYALEMARILDPGKVYFNYRVISEGDCTQKHQKGLDVVLGAESAAIILDDTEFVWQKHKENLILMDRYHFFSSSGRPFGFNIKSLSETKMDESETDGALASVLRVLKRVHQMFFPEGVDVKELMGGDVRQMLKSVRKEVLKDCKLVFTRVWKVGVRVENQKLWQMAEQLGATCVEELDQSVTHVVSTDTGTEKSRWAVKHKKFLVHPRWIEAANLLWKRHPEEQFAVDHIKNQ